MAFRYDVTELNTAVKPSAFSALFAEGFDRVIYIDPDTWSLSGFLELEILMDGGAEAVLTPHVTHPLPADGRSPGDEDILRVGVYNLGFLALARSEQTAAMLDWWADRLRTGAVVDLPRGLFTDQKWCDLLPCFVESCAVLRHPGYNVAYWNLMHRPIRRADGGWTAADAPLRFFHFSGADLDRPSVSRHQDRLTLADLGEHGAELFADYRREVRKLGRPGDGNLAYSLGKGSAGEPIPQALRRLYRTELDGEGGGGASPWARVAGYAMETPEDPPPVEGLPLNRLMLSVWRAGPDLQTAFNLRRFEGRLGFVHWWLAGEDPRLEGLEAYIKDVAHRLDLAAAERAWPHGRHGGVGLHRALALAVMQRAPHLRPLYRRLPEGLRLRVRNRLRAAATGESTQDLGRPARRLPKADAPGPGALLVGYARGELGMGEHVRMTAASLQAAGAPFGIYNFDRAVVARQEDRRFDRLLTSAPAFRANVLHINADQLPLAFETLGEALLKDRVNIGYPAWELPELPDAWRPALDRLDEIWAPSRFIEEALTSKLRRPVVHMPLAVELADGYADWSRSDFGLPSGRFTFLFSFDFDSFTSRKNPEAVLAAFKQAFPRPRRTVPSLF